MSDGDGGRFSQTRFTRDAIASDELCARVRPFARVLCVL